MSETAPVSRPAGVLVTGAGGGIGQALCAAFSAAGYRVVATDRAEIPLGAERAVPADLHRLVEDGAARGAFHLAVQDALAGSALAIIVNNAAVQLLGVPGTLELAQFRRSLDLNVCAPFALVECFLSELTAARGAVINIGSVHAALSKPGFLAYAVSKAALAGLTRSLALELAPRGIRVNEVRPGATATPMLAAGFADNPAGLARLAAHQPLGRCATPAEIAAVAVFLASPGAAFMTGAVVNVDGGIAVRLHDPA